MARFVLLYLSSLISASVFANPMGRDETSVLDRVGNCDQKDHTFNPGQTYEYKYFGKVETGLGFGDSKAVGLAVDCQLQLSVPEACEYRLKVSLCEVYESEGKQDDENEQGFKNLEEEVLALESREVSRQGFQKSDRSLEFNEQVTRHSIQAQVSNGEIKRVIYEDEEEIWVINFKKGILDALNVRGDAESQRDILMMENGIHGLCPTKYSEKTSRNHIIVHKDLDSCIHRSKNNWQLSPLVPFNNMSMLSTLMDANIVCSYKLNREGVQQSFHIQTMTCRETHRLMPLPWSSSIAGAAVNITQRLQFVNKLPGAEQINRHLDTKTITSILYEHANTTDVNCKKTGGDADEILKDLVQQAINGLNLNAPATFDNFVNELRSSNNLEDVLQQANMFQDNEHEIAKYFLIQGLVQCNAPACIGSLTSLIQSKEIPEQVFGPVVMALGLSNHQDPLFLDEIRRLCEIKPSRSCTLMMGALAYNLMDSNDQILEDHESAQSIQKAAKFLVDLIEDNKCKPTDKLYRAEEDSEATKLIIALKAIGNLGTVPRKLQDSMPKKWKKSAHNSVTQGSLDEIDVEQKIAKCLDDKSVSSNVTVAAIHAYRRFVPTRFIQEKLLAVLRDDERSHEVRMSACMASVRVASDRETVRKIIKIMEEEKIDQVKAFMISHLRSVLKSEDPHYKNVAEHIKAVLKEKGQKLPGIQARIPHSLHMELSKFYKVPFLDNEENDFGTQVEGSVMFTTKSYVPKSAHLNVSAQLWGDYLNAVEVGIDMQGIDDLVEKVVGPQGYFAKSKYIKKVRELVSRSIKFAEDLAYKYLKLQYVKDFSSRLMQIIQSKKVEEMIDQGLRFFQNVDNIELQKILRKIRNSDMEDLVKLIQKTIPQTHQFAKVIEKLKRIRLQDVSEDLIVQMLESSGISTAKAQKILRQISEAGIDMVAITGWIRQADFLTLKDQLSNLRIDEIQQKFQLVLQKAKQWLRQFGTKYDLPDLSSFIQMVQKMLKDPSGIVELKDQFMESSRRFTNRYIGSDDDDDQSDDYEETDDLSLDQTEWGKHVKALKHRENESEVLDATVFFRILGDEMGFISLSDIREFFEYDNLEIFNYQQVWEDILDGFDIQPTFAGKMEGLHHVSTGLGLPLQISFNITSVATVHVKVQPQGSTLRKSVVEVEPSGAMQVVIGTTVDIPSIHSISTVSNTTVKSEFAVKLLLDIRQNAVEIELKKPEELDLLHVYHEIKLIKDEEDFQPFDNSKTDEAKATKCFPDIMAKLTGLQVCADIETSKLMGIPLLSHGPHQIRISVQENLQSGLDHVKFAATHDGQGQHNRFEFNFCASDRRSQREARAILIHDCDRNEVDLKFDIPERTYPRLHVFLRNLSAPSAVFGVEAGFDVEYDEAQHYNASIAGIAEVFGYEQYGNKRLVDAINEAYFNYTVKGSIQSPMAWMNVSSTTAKMAEKLMMEHNLTYWISENVGMPIVQKIKLIGAANRQGVIKFVVRHGIQLKSDPVNHDLQTFVQLLTFPLNVPEPVFSQVAQAEIHRDFRHLGFHFNTSVLNHHHELEFFNISTNVNDITELRQLNRPASFALNISRNDWFIALNGELKKDSTEYTLSHEFTGYTMLLTDCQNTLECAFETLKSDIQRTTFILKPMTNAIEWPQQPHKGHKVRESGETYGREKLLPKTLKIFLKHKIKEKTEYTGGAGLFADKISRPGARAFVLTSLVTLKGPQLGSQNEIRSITLFGNDAGDQQAHLSLWIMHNTSATNFPFSVDHFAQFVINKSLKHGFRFFISSSFDHTDSRLFGINAGIKVTPQDLQLQGNIEVDTPVFDVSAEAEVSKPTDGIIELKYNSRTESTKSDIFNHDLKTAIKVGFGKIRGTVILRHPKLNVDVQTESDLFACDDTVSEDIDEDNGIDSKKNRSLLGNNLSRNFEGQQSTFMGLTFQKIKSSVQSMEPKLTGTLYIRGSHQDVFPTMKIDGKVTIRQLRLDVQVENVSPLFKDLNISKRYTAIGELQGRKAFAKLIVGERGEAGVEAILKSDKNALVKLYDLGLVQSGETMHAQLTFELPTENTVATKIFVNPQSLPTLTQAVRENGKYVFQISKQMIQDKWQSALLEAKRIWSDEGHPVYQLTQPFIQGSMEDLVDRNLQPVKVYYQQCTNAASRLYEDLSVLEMFSIDKGEIMQEGKKLLKNITENTALGWIAKDLPSAIELTHKLEEIISRNFPQQFRMVQSRESCITMKSCDSIGALESTQGLLVELIGSVKPEQTNQIAASVKDVLLAIISGLKKTLRQNQPLKSILNGIDINAFEDSIRSADIPDLDSVVQLIKSGGILAKSMIVDKLESVMETKNGELVITSSHPLKWNNFKKLPKLTDQIEQRLSTFYGNVKLKLLKFQKDGSFEISSNEDDKPIRVHLPPMKNFPENGMFYQTAMMLGDRQIMTFDGKVYSIPESIDSDCVYLLARGSKRQNFALVKRKDGITLTLPEMVVSVDYDNLVYINQSSNAVQLPIESANRRAQIKLIGDTVQIESETGVQLEWRGNKKECLIKISSEMWDENLGLLGTNDNEADNDFKLPTGKQATGVEDFVNAFEVSRKAGCRATHRMDNQRSQECPKSVKCAAFFRNTDSEVSSCFSVVDPVQFLQICEDRSKKCDRSQAEQGVCEILTAYRTACSSRGVKTEAPEACETCDGRKENSKWSSRGNKNQVDMVVLVSEHKDFLKKTQSPAEKIQKISEAVTLKLKDLNEQKLRVALAGFSGAGIHKDGHTHTIEHEQFGTSEGLGRALKSLQFNGSQETDVLDAVDFVLQSYDFRPDATKLLLIFDPTETEHIPGHNRHNEIKEKLIERGVIATIFSSYEELKERHLGINYDGTVFSSKKINSQMTGEMPEMKLSRLAKATRGAVFQLDALVDSDDSIKQSRLEETAVQTIFRQVQNESIMCKTCVCQQTELKQMISTCKVSAC